MTMMMAHEFKPLLEGEGGGESSSSRRLSGNYRKAAALVDLAVDGSGVPERIIGLPDIERAVKIHFIFIRFDIIWTLNYFALIALSFFEKPLWCSSVSEVSCSNRDYYYLGELPYLTRIESLAFEGITLIVLVVHTLFPILYEGGYLYYRNHVNKLKVISLLILTAALVVDILSLASVAVYSLPRRIAPYIRVVFFILNIRGLRDNLVVLGGMVFTYLNVLALGLLFLVFSSWLAYVIFEDTQQGTTFFLSYPTTLYQMFVLFTTSNNPDVWIPAYKSLRWSALFFILYVLLGVYFVTNLVLAVIYDCFKAEALDFYFTSLHGLLTQLVKQVNAKDKMRKIILGRAFNLIDEDGFGSLNKEQCFRLFEELNNYRRQPKISIENFEFVFDAMDHSGDYTIDADEFIDIYYAIALKFQQKDAEPWLKKFRFYNSSRSRTLKNFVKSTKFENVVVVLLLLNLITIIIETTLDIQNNTGQKFWQKVEFVFGWIYAVEMALKVYTYGFENLWKDGQNQFDFIITWVIVIGETATFISPEELTFISKGQCIRYLLIARMLRLIRLLMLAQSYRAFVATFLTLIPSLMPYLGTVFCVMCIYCTLGIQIFGGIVNAGNPDLPATDLVDSDYLLFNFNDYPNGMVTLFNLLVMGSWHIWMQDYATLTGTSWTYAYFISFYLITILLFLNLIVAFVLEAFFAELEIEEGTRTKVWGQLNTGSKTHNLRVDMLLHRILSSQLQHSPPSSP